MAKDLFHSLKNLGITNCHLIGHSVGAKVAARAATMCKEFEGTILSLTMMDLSPVQYSVDDFEEVLTCLQSLLEISHKTLSRKDVAKPEIFQMIESHFPDNTMCKFIQSSVVPTTEPDETIRFDWSFNLEGILASFHHLLGFPEEDIPSYPVPLLLMKGSKSNYVKMIHLLHAVRYFPKHSIVAVRDASHWLHHDQPQQSSDVVAKFIKSPTTPV
jgi:esterase